MWRLFRTSHYLSGAEFILRQHHIDKFDKNDGKWILKKPHPLLCQSVSPLLCVAVLDFRAVPRWGGFFFVNP